jgi:hypothetical protein
MQNVLVVNVTKKLFVYVRTQNFVIYTVPYCHQKIKNNLNVNSIVRSFKFILKVGVEESIVNALYV